LLFADVLRVIHLSLDDKALRENMMYTKSRFVILSIKPGFAGESNA